MKKLATLILRSTTALLCLSTVSALAGYITPRVPPASTRPAAKSSSSVLTPVGALHTLQTVTTTHNDGPGSLRQAIAKSAPGDVINFALKLPATIVLTSTLVIDQDLTVLGPGPEKLTVLRSKGTNTPSFRVFDIEAGEVVLAGITIRNGSAFSGTNIHDNLGGGILNRGMLTVSNCVVAGNSAPTTDWGTNFSPSVSVGFGAGIFTDQGSQLTIVNSTIKDNTASGAGGALNTFYAENIFVVGSTLSGNFAGVQGGGLNMQGRAGALQNSTISTNSTAPDGTASAYLLITFSGESATLDITACTIARNFGSTNGACVLAALTGNQGLTNNLLSTLVADNEAPNFFLDGNPVLQSLGHNLDSDGTSGLVNGVNGDLVGTPASPIDAKLGALLNNGGPTFTMALLPGSPALGAAACSDAQGAPLTVDQRGFPRPQVTGCDIGAFENQAPTLICPAAQTLEAHGAHGTAQAKLTATVDDADGDPLIVVWSVNGIPRQTNNVAASHPPKPHTVTFKAQFSVGTNDVSVWVSDQKAVPVACMTSVIVREAIPPRIISITASPNVLWPPNNKLVPVTLTVRATDESGPVTSRITAVSSNEPADATSPDWVITGDLSLLLRAERLGQGHGRIYTITVQCSDAVGNTSTGTVQVTVPHDNGH